MRLVDTFWFNAIWFQATWFCCVIGREAWVPLALLSLALHFALVEDRAGELRRLLPVALIGIAVDVALTLSVITNDPQILARARRALRAVMDDAPRLASVPLRQPERED